MSIPHLERHKQPTTNATNGSGELINAVRIGVGQRDSPGR